MALQDYFSHTGKDGSTAATRSKKVGYEAYYLGENIAAGYSTPQSVVQGWINSSGHRANLLNVNYTELGVGYEFLSNDTGSVNYYHYWTQVFGSGDLNPNSYLPGSNPAPTEIKGTKDNDTLTAGIGDQTIYGYAGNDVIKAGAGNDIVYGDQGRDSLYGEDGDDSLIGGAGNDNLVGGNGKDKLLGVQPGVSLAGKKQIDSLTGGNDADLFQLGDSTRAYYNDGLASSQGLGDYALITDFSLTQQDVIQLNGQASYYQLGTSPNGLPSGTAIFLKTADVNELIGIIQGVTNLSLTNAAFSFV
jgi:Ca2+-binding RTX toxin-like protein